MEPAGGIKFLEAQIVVDMEPARTALARYFPGFPHEQLSDAPSAESGMDAGVENEGVDAAIPCHIHEADQPLPVIGTDMGKASRQ